MKSSPGISSFPGLDRERVAQKKRMTFRPGRKTPMIIICFLFLYLLISFIAHFQKLNTLQQDIKGIEQQVQELKLKNDDLRIQLKQVQSDTYIEQVAREKLGLVKPGESRIVPVPKTEEKNN